MALDRRCIWTVFIMGNVPLCLRSRVLCAPLSITVIWSSGDLHKGSNLFQPGEIHWLATPIQKPWSRDHRESAQISVAILFEKKLGGCSAVLILREEKPQSSP